jgi:hypothetical protein
MVSRVNAAQPSKAIKLQSPAQHTDSTKTKQHRNKKVSGKNKL